MMRIKNIHPPLWEGPSGKLKGHLKAFLLFIISTLTLLREASAEFNYENLREKARAQAAKEYHADLNPELPDALKKLTYDDYRRIQFRRDKVPWMEQNLPFRIGFFHRGYLYTDPVQIHLIEGGQVNDLQFSPELFDYFGIENISKSLPNGLQFAGFKVAYATNGSPHVPEIASFVGASFFRLVSDSQRYGAAGRGLAINTAEPTGEEFPRFTEFWIQKPEKFDDSIRIMALMDSPSATGAFEFVIRAGESTVMDVKTSLFLRKDVKKIGFAPLTSMFMQGKNHTRYLPDFRPEVHDSDGLLWQNSPGEWLWRPLINPTKTHQVSRFQLNDPTGFGLMQRERDFHAYEDLDSRSELRPSLWVEPRNKWGVGALELVEIPSLAEGNDNIVAYWVPERQPTGGQDFFLTYRISALMSGPPESPPLLVASTRIAPEHDNIPPRFVIDFKGKPVLGTNGQVTAKVDTSRGEIRNLNVQKNEVTSDWRVFFDLLGIGNESVDLHLLLNSGDQVLSETWIYHYQSP